MSAPKAAATEATFFDLEPDVRDVESMVDLVMHLVDEHFSNSAENGYYRIHEHDGARLMFTVGMAVDLARKASATYYAAMKNKQEKGRLEVAA